MAITMGKNNKLLVKCFLKNYNKIAIESSKQKISFNDLKNKSFELIEYFKKSGVKKGEVISVKLPNSIELIYCYFACIFGGFIICPISNDIKEAETKKIIKSVRSKLFIKDISKMKYIKTKNDYFKSYNPKKIMGIFLTSGTTSGPKGVCHSSENLVQNAAVFNKQNKINKARFYHVFPMSYMAGFLNSIISPIICGGTIIFDKQFSIYFAINFSKIIKNRNIDYLWLNPTMINIINNFQKKRVRLNSKLKIFVGTAPLNLKDKNDFYKKFHISLKESYGMTEILIFSSQINNKREQYSNVGSLLSGCKIFKNKERQLIVSSKFTNRYFFELKRKKYIKNKKFKRFDTGDLGLKDKNKNLIILGREKNIIIKGGKNVNPEELEKKIIKLSGISECCVLPIKDRHYGENICILLKTKKNKKLNISKLEKFIQFNFSKIEFPKKIIHVKNIQKNKNYKIDRKYLIKNLFIKSKQAIYEKNY
jgi:acyl-coenzyme A synthetase/AMP-(fatty) acid ligase